MIRSAPAPIRVGLIGYGFSGKTFHAPLIRSVPGLELCMIASSDERKVHADFPDLRVVADPLVAAASPDIDLIVIATPNDSHAPLARAALMADKHVVVDKPFTLTLSEARELIVIASRRDRLLSVFHNRRWDSDYRSVEQAITDGVVGTVKQFDSHFDRFRPRIRDRWREGEGPGSGVWFDLGPHLVDQALQLFGLPDRVTAALARLRDGALSDDWAHVVLDYPALRVVLQASMVVAGGSPRFVVHGDAGSIVKRHGDVQEGQLLAGLAPGAPDWGHDPDPLLVYDGDGNRRLLPALAGDQRLFYAHMVEALRGSAPNPVSPEQAIAVMACIEAAFESARAHASVAPPLTAEERAAFDKSCTRPPVRR